MHLNYEFITSSAFNPFFIEAHPRLFESNFDFNVMEAMSLEERLKLKELNEPFKDVKEYYLVAKDGDQIVGWSFGVQKSNQDFYMINSAVFPAYRRKRVYTELMRRAVDHIKEMGFQHIYSRHKMTNNDIIIPKLKFGFVISGMEVNDTFGNMVQLSYYTNPKRRELLDIRSGMRKPTDEDLSLIK